MMTDRLLHITDLHFWEVVRNPLALLNKRALGNVNVYLRRRHEFHMDQADAFADVALATGIRTLLIGGDFTSTATEHEFALARKWVMRLAGKGMAIHLLPGNHDVYTFESVRRRRFEHYFREFIPQDGYPARVMLPGGTRLVLVPTVTPNFISSKGRITRKELRAVERLLAECPDGPLLVAGHYPLLHKTYSYDSSPSRRLRNAEALRDLLGACPQTILYLSGHVHRFSHCIDPDYPRLHHLTSNAFFLQRHHDDVRGAFTEIHVNSKGFQVFQHVLKQDWDISLEPVQRLDTPD